MMNIQAIVVGVVTNISMCPDNSDKAIATVTIVNQDGELTERSFKVMYDLGPKPSIGEVVGVKFHLPLDVIRDMNNEDIVETSFTPNEE